MKFTIRKYLTNKSILLEDKIDEIENYYNKIICNFELGSIKTFYLGFIITDLENDDFYKIRKIKFIKGKKNINKKLNLFDSDFIEMEIKFSLKDFNQNNLSEIILIINQKLTQILANTSDSTFFNRTLFLSLINR